MIDPPQRKSIPTRGRTLDYAAWVYDVFEPVLMLGQHEPYNQSIIDALGLEPRHRVLDLGCGTGVLTRLAADRLDPGAGGILSGDRRGGENDRDRGEETLQPRVPF